MERIVEEIELPALRELRNVDCQTSRCSTNAYGTGRLLHIVDSILVHWYVEFHCPDCDTLSRTNSMRVDALASAIRAAKPSQHDAIARAWVAECPPIYPCS